MVKVSFPTWSSLHGDYIYIYIYIDIHAYIHIYIYTHTHTILYCSGGWGGGNLEDLSPKLWTLNLLRLSLASFVLLSELSELGAHSLLQPLGFRV